LPGPNTIAQLTGATVSALEQSGLRSVSRAFYDLGKNSFSLIKNIRDGNISDPERR
jgi:hypothetical protein